MRWITLCTTLPLAVNDNNFITEHVQAEIKNVSVWVTYSIRWRCGDSDFGAV